MNSKDIRIAYFSMEIAIDERIKTYSGGLGVLAGDCLKTAADMNLPVVGVTLLYKGGYFKQKLSSNGWQIEIDDPWDMNLLEDTNVFVNVNLYGRNVKLRVWKYVRKNRFGKGMPILFLDSDVEGNNEEDREITKKLYVGDRLAQEVILGIGGTRALKKLGYDKLETYHMNEGHAALLTLELYKTLGKETGKYHDNNVKNLCVFTTHTPVAAGHDKFAYERVKNILQGENDILPWHIEKLAGYGELNMTLLAMNLSRYTNAVSKKHKEVSMNMFPGFIIDSITNGVEAQRWVCEELAILYDEYIPDWRIDACKLKEAMNIPDDKIWNAHKDAKKRLMDYINNSNPDNSFRDDVLTIGFARRAATYKHGGMIFENIKRLIDVSRGKVQFVFAGKAHPNDGAGKDIIRSIAQLAEEYEGELKLVFLENYDIHLAKTLVSGVDIWLNTPIPPHEASGTSGMKAAHNGVPHFSTLDGWSIESFKRSGGGWIILDKNQFYNKLEFEIIPLYYMNDKSGWINQMKRSIAYAASYFNTNRMLSEYKVKAYRLY